MYCCMIIDSTFICLYDIDSYTASSQHDGDDVYSWFRPIRVHTHELNLNHHLIDSDVILIRDLVSHSVNKLSQIFSGNKDYNYLSPGSWLFQTVACKHFTFHIRNNCLSLIGLYKHQSSYSPPINLNTIRYHWSDDSQQHPNA